MAFQICRHIKTNGLQCQSPNLANKPYCYFHDRLARTHTHYRAQPHHGPRVLDLGPAEDREAVQVAISTVINALATDQIDPKRATALLYGLQLASMNAARLDLQPRWKNIVRNTDPDEPALALPGALSHQDELEASLFEDVFGDDTTEDEDDEDQDNEEEENEEGDEN